MLAHEDQQPLGPRRGVAGHHGVVEHQERLVICCPGRNTDFFLMNTCSDNYDRKQTNKLNLITLITLIGTSIFSATKRNM
jgi:hypothetical protein